MVYLPDISSTRGELQSQMALMIIADLFLIYYNLNDIEIRLIGDNTGIQHKCSNPSLRSLKSHRQPNTDLFLQHEQAKRLKKQSHTWAKSHQDKEEWESINDLFHQKVQSYIQHMV
jgi:hypothetical protein